MWGKDKKGIKKTMEYRITPAHAGKSIVWYASPPFTSDHPRTCEEKAEVLTAGAEETGSPPHMWGKGF